MAFRATFLPPRRPLLAGVAAGLLAAFALAAAMVSFGWPLMRRPIAHLLGEKIGRTVIIGGLERVGGSPLVPVLRVRGVRVVQPGWAGPGDMATIREARIELPLLPLLLGRGHPRAIAIEGLDLHLVRPLTGLANWRKTGLPLAPSGAASPDLGRLTVRDARIRLDDVWQDRHFSAALAIDARGTRLAGTGRLGAAPARIALTGAPVRGQPDWPFRLSIDAATLRLTLAGTAAAPLDLGHFRARAVARGHDLTDLDRVIEAGLPASQPFAFAAAIAHERPRWIVTGLTGRVGRSDVAGAVTVDKQDGRTLLQASLLSNGFDFDDLATDAQLAAADAKARRLGPRFFPETRIDLSRLSTTDGTLTVDLRHLLFRTPSAFQSFRGALTLDHGVLTVAPLVATLVSGRVTGTAVVRHQGTMPVLSADLTLGGDARIEKIMTTASRMTGALRGRARVSGPGATVREAMAHASGVVGFAVTGGTLDRRAALAAASDVGRAMTTGKQQDTPLHCMTGRFVAARGIARPAPLVIDTEVGLDEGSGTVDLSTERLDIALHGQAKLKGGLRLDQPFRVQGVLKAPTIVVPPKAGSVGNILKMVGRAMVGKTPPPVGGADCAGLAATALR